VQAARDGPDVTQWQSAAVFVSEPSQSSCLSQASTINPSDPMTKSVCKPTGYASDAGSFGSTGSTPHAAPQGRFGGGGMQTNALYDSSPPPRPAGLRFPGPQQPDGAASPAGSGFAPSPGMRPPAVSPMVRSSRVYPTAANRLWDSELYLCCHD